MVDESTRSPNDRRSSLSLKRPEHPRSSKPTYPRASIWAIRILGACSLLGLGLLVCADLESWSIHLTTHDCAVYTALFLVLVAALLHRLLRHTTLVHLARLSDASVVEAWFVEATNVESRFDAPDERPTKYAEKKRHLEEEVERLTRIGKASWTEYEVLPLTQLLVDFLGTDDLIVQARSALLDLEEYATDSAYHYERAQYERRRKEIDLAIEIIDNQPSGEASSEKPLLARDTRTERLRAELRTILDHVASYEQNWAMGSVLLGGLKYSAALTIPILLIAGLLPLRDLLTDRLLQPL